MSPAVSRAAVVIATALIVTTGCAGREYVQETSLVTAGHVDSLKRDYARYLQRVELDASYRIDLLAQDRQRLARAEQSLGQRITELRDGTPALVGRFLTEGQERIKTDRAVAQRAEVERKSLMQAQKKLEQDALDQLKGLSKQLLELAEPAAFNEDVKFLIEYFQAVNKATSDLDAKAREAKDKADTLQPSSTVK